MKPETTITVAIIVFILAMSGCMSVVSVGAEPGSPERPPVERIQDVCLPPRSMRCQPPPATPQQAVRRQLNREGMGWAWWTAQAIIYCESKWDPYARGAAGEYGLWQVHPIHDWRWDGRDWTDPADNTEVAIAIYRDAGNSFSPWSCYR